MCQSRNQALRLGPRQRSTGSSIILSMSRTPIPQLLPLHLQRMWPASRPGLPFGRFSIPHTRRGGGARWQHAIGQIAQVLVHYSSTARPLVCSATLPPRFHCLAYNAAEDSTRAHTPSPALGIPRESTDSSFSALAQMLLRALAAISPTTWLQ